MKTLISYSCKWLGDGTIEFGNTLLPEELPPMNWIAIANREEQNKLYTLLNWWRVSDYEANKWVDKGSGRIETNRNKEIKTS